MSDPSLKITLTPSDEALHEFDAQNGVEPFRIIAERIAAGHDFWTTHPIVDEISAALEDAYNLGERRGPLAAASTQSHFGEMRTPDAGAK